MGGVDRFRSGDYAVSLQSDYDCQRCGGSESVGFRAGFGGCARFALFIVAWLLKKFGEPIRTFIEKNLGILSVLFLLLLIGGFAAIKYL